jgi:hypothetical protein
MKEVYDQGHYVTADGAPDSVLGLRAVFSRGEDPHGSGPPAQTTVQAKKEAGYWNKYGTSHLTPFAVENEVHG